MWRDRSLSCLRRYQGYYLENDLVLLAWEWWICRQDTDLCSSTMGLYIPHGTYVCMEWASQFPWARSLLNTLSISSRLLRSNLEGFSSFRGLSSCFCSISWGFWEADFLGQGCMSLLLDISERCLLLWLVMLLLILSCSRVYYHVGCERLVLVPLGAASARCCWFGLEPDV